MIARSRVYWRQMDHAQILVLALANVPTMITVLIGILINNSRISDLNSRMSSFESRMNSFENRMNALENRLTTLDHKFDTRFDLLMSKVVEIDNRLTRLEAQSR